jgi:NAD-dependent SIR2 family protein deacetylase
MESAELLRLFTVQEAPRLMLLLGAGASVGSGIPTATDMVWIFKREIYCSETGASKEAFRDLSIERNQRYLQGYFDKNGNYPICWAENDYSFYFERCYPDQRDRRTFIRQVVSQGKPTIGYECLAVLISQTRVDLVWTTNFDDLIERAERPDSPHRLYHVGQDSRGIGTILSEGLRPVLVKLHGDYRYDSLKNTDEETRYLDAELRTHLVRLCNDNGMIVMGYSGRDESVISALEEAIENDGFRNGLYWCIREGDQPRLRIEKLVERAVQKTGRGGFVEIESFDDFLFRLYRQCGLKDRQIDEKAGVLFEQRRPFVLITEREPRDPLKVNAIKISEYPTSPYKFKTTIETWRELREIIAQQPIVAGLLRGCVVAFGNRERIRSVFGDKVIDPMEVSDIRPSDLIRSDSVMMGLFYDIVGRSLVERYGLRRIGRRSFFICDPVLQGAERNFRFQHQREQHSIMVAMNDQRAIVHEAFAFQLEFHEESLWFILNPNVEVTSDGENLVPFEQRKITVNRIMSGRFNMEIHERLLFWFYYLSSICTPISFMFPPEDDSGVKIVLDSHYAFTSRKALKG